MHTCIISGNDLRDKVNGILSQYPWFADYPLTCHAKCARWDIAREHGSKAGNAWQEYDSALWLLDGSSAGKRT